MSDHDPIDRAYAQAEAMLDDEAARAARRARVLGALAGDAGAAPAVSSPPKQRAIPAAGWLAAASVAGVSVLVAVQLSTPPVIERPASAAETPVAAPPAPPTSPSAPATAPAVDAPEPAPPAVPRTQASPPADVADAAPSPFPMPPSRRMETPAFSAPPAAPPSAPQAPRDNVEALIVAGETASPPPSARATRSAPAMAQAPAPPADQAARLRAAAAAGRLEELTALLAQGTPVDAPDGTGETALMKSVQANRPAAAALLLRHGASLDRTNRSGVSARDMAASIDDPELNRALGLEP